MKNVIGIIAILALVIGGLLFGSYISTSNKEIRLVSQAKAQNGKIEVVFDNMVKIISGKSQVTSAYKDGFKEIFVGIMEGRYSKGDGALLKLVQEQNPNFDASMYKDLMNTIEVERTKFAFEQEVMLDVVRTHDNLLATFPSSLFVGNRPHIVYVVISSTASKQVMETRVEEDKKIF